MKYSKMVEMSQEKSREKVARVKNRNSKKCLIGKSE